MNATAKPSRRGGLKRVLQQVLFWLWNAIFVAIMALGFFPETVPQIIKSVQSGTTPTVYLFFALTLVMIPFAAVLIGLFVLRKSPERLFALGYVVEWPLLLILLFRFFFIREGNPAITVLLVWLAIGLTAFVWHLLDRRLDSRPTVWLTLRLAGLSLLFAGTIYAAIWLLFYVPPLAVGLYQMLHGIFSGSNFLFDNSQLSFFEALRTIALSLLGFSLIIFSGSLIILMPVVAPVLAGRAWWHSLQSTLKPGRGWPGFAATLLPVAAVFAVLVLNMRQPQGEAFALLENPPATPQAAQVLLQRQDDIRAGLLNAYLASYRYMSAAGEVRHISSLYEGTLNVSKETAWQFELAYEQVIRPMLYEPVHPAKLDSPDNQRLSTESADAARLYEQFFDKPIEKAELSAIVEAVRDNPDGSQTEVAWQAVDDREVHLDQQDIQISEHGDWADVEIHEVYRNHTYQRQEVVYYFSLPETAVITGLWLGSSADRAQAFAYQVAPRGAAQASYRNELVQRLDPALVEQIGPRQYRLRAFPVLPQSWSSATRDINPGSELHVWLSYAAMAQNGAWPLPQLAERRNVYWDNQTVHQVNGSPLTTTGDAWLPPSIPASEPVSPTPHRVDFPDGQTVIARPISAAQPAVPARLRLAVVLDRSYSMKAYASAVTQSVNQLKAQNQLAIAPDIYLTSSQYRGTGPVRMQLASYNPDQEFYFGGQNASDLLVQFQQLSAGKSYDAVLILTDGAGFSLGQGNASLPVTDTPVWVVHLGGSLPLGYDDGTLQAIQSSGGGVAGSLDEALQRYAFSLKNAGQADQVDGYEWKVVPTGQAGSLSNAVPVIWAKNSPSGGMAALAARRLVLASIVQYRASLDKVGVLDQLNKLAVDSSIVTPYSSMLVLVNSVQQSTLDKLENQADRYQREVEGVGLTNPQSINALPIVGVPEPEEWVLMGIALLGLVYAYRRKLSWSQRG
jgi:putative PEP-CTERM system integral membrane protein